MSRLFLFFSAFAVGLTVSRATDVEVQAPNSKLPVYRPALVGSGPTAIINTIDTKALLQQGQKDAAIMFLCSVMKSGDVVWSGTYRGTPGSQLLEKEVLKRLDGAKFIPAVYEHQPVGAIFYGSVFFAVIEGKPRLRIFANQEGDELKKESDFVGPQPFSGSGSGFTGFHYPENLPVQVRGAAELRMKVSATGILQDMHVASEDPPLLGLGDAAMEDFSKARFIPAFRDGKPVESTVTIPVFFHPR
jgi:hypothetical protein